RHLPNPNRSPVLPPSNRYLYTVHRPIHAKPVQGTSAHPRENPPGRFRILSPSRQIRVCTSLPPPARHSACRVTVPPVPCASFEQEGAKSKTGGTDCSYCRSRHEIPSGSWRSHQITTQAAVPF